jgi:TetR/AcrR family transcriptional regulator, tetracycline repressor protein
MYSCPVRTPGQRAGLTRDQVLDAALDLVDEGGAAALTMRRVAQRLGVAPNALYSHVADRAALLDAVLDARLAAVAVPEPGPDPVADLAELMVRTYDLLVGRPDLVPLYLARQGSRGPQARRLGAAMLDLLAAAGVTGAGADEARRVLIVHTIGVAAFASPLDEDRPLGPAESRRHHERGLRWLLAGITGG